MDAVDFASGSGRSKRIKDKDLVSNLPDEILHQILSFLPTKDLVRTSVLSTRWRKVWTFFSVIDINMVQENKMQFREEEILIPSVARIRKFRFNLSTPMTDASVREILIPSIARIRKLHLNLEEPAVEGSVVMLWVDRVMEHKVQELDISLPEQTLYRLPDRLFSYDSLMELKLSMDCELTVPNYVCFPMLKILHLSRLKFSNLQSIQKLFSSCPVLEKLALRDCNWGRINSILIYIPSLQKLSIEYDDDPLAARYCLSFKIMISAPNLLSLYCRSHIPMDLVFYQSSLEDASIEVLGSVFVNLESSLQKTLNLLHGIQGVKSLTLLSCTLKILLIEKNLHALLPSFDNLKHLHVNCSRDANECIPRALIKVLQKTPNLHSLSINANPVPDAFTEEYKYNVIPECFKTSLRRFIFHKLYGYESEVLLLKYMLENAPHLESMLIIYSKVYLSEDKKEEIRNELELSRGAATNCEIKFV